MNQQSGLIRFVVLIIIIVIIFFIFDIGASDFWQRFVEEPIKALISGDVFKDVGESIEERNSI